MLDAIVWGLVQGLSEFLPVSSSGHLVLVPAFLDLVGIDVGNPDLATSAVLHLGTLLAVLAYYRLDLVRVLRSPTDPRSRHLMAMLAIGTVPAMIGLPLRSTLERIEETPRLVAGALLVTALILFVGTLARRGTRRLEDLRPRDALMIGLAQAVALVPGVSRSGSTITGALLRGLDRAEAARFSFLLAVPAIAGGGLLSLLDVSGSEVGAGAIAAGLITAALSGYLAIAALVRLLVRRGFSPFVWYCAAVGVLGLVVL